MKFDIDVMYVRVSYVDVVLFIFDVIGFFYIVIDIVYLNLFIYLFDMWIGNV